MDAAALAGPPTLLERLQVLRGTLALRESSSYAFFCVSKLNEIVSAAFVILVGMFRPENKGRSVRRAAYDTMYRYMASSGWSIRQMLYFGGAQDSTQVYDAWVRKHKLENVTDELDGAKLHWVGPRSYESVLIYCHGEH